MKLSSWMSVVLFWLLPLYSSAQPAKETRETRFRDLGGGVVEDKMTHLQWTQHDNGRTIDGHEAAKYCQSLQLGGGRWHLPEITELESICSSEFERSCLYQERQEKCRVHPSFQLTGWALWSTTRSPYNPKDSRIFNFTLYLDCRKISTDVSENLYIAPFARAVCVRGAS